jgi:hypothetical protein
VNVTGGAAGSTGALLQPAPTDMAARTRAERAIVRFMFKRLLLGGREVAPLVVHYQELFHEAKAENSLKNTIQFGGAVDPKWLSCNHR